MSKLKAFSVVELLITMIVLSFGYMLIMPSIVGYTSKNKATSSTPIEIAYSYSGDAAKTNIMQATATMAAQNSGLIKGLCADNQCFIDKYSTVLSAMKKCDASNVNECWHNTDNAVAAMVLANGTFFAITDTDTDSNCNSEICANLKIDVNGFAPPNQEGKDIFKASIGSGTSVNFN